MLMGQPILFLLLFVFVFGNTLGAGIAGVGGGRADYLTYITPAIVVMAVASVALGTAVSVAIGHDPGHRRAVPDDAHRPGLRAGRARRRCARADRARRRGRPRRGAPARLPARAPASTDWLGVVGIVLLLALALTWLTVALGVQADSVETASNTPMPLVLLPFLGSGFVPTDSMPAGVRWFAEYQPFTPVMETLRGFLAGTPSEHDAAARGRVVRPDHRTQRDLGGALVPAQGDGVGR